MVILGIETSCDDTTIAVIEIKEKKGSTFPSFHILSNIISSQTKIHQEYGGVVPSLAKRAHQENLVPVLLEALLPIKLPANSKSETINSKQSLNSKLKILKRILEREPELLEKFEKHILPMEVPKIDLIAVTYGPGLEPALWAGVNFARALSYWWSIPLVGVDHMEGHIAANFLQEIGGNSTQSSDGSPHRMIGAKSEARNSKQILNSKTLNSKHGNIIFPALVLAVSGGHTQLILVKDILKYKLLGETVDDAAGEGFDKVARMLGLGFPGGPEIAKLAKGGDPKAFDFPRPMAHTKDYNFSFSGLKTAVLYKLKDICRTSDVLHIKQKRNIAASFQQAVADVLISKTIKATKEYGAKTIMLAGGVAANTELREQLGRKIKEEIPDTRYRIPDTKLATDNAAMIAAAAYFHREEASLDLWKTLEANGGLQIDKKHSAR